MTDPDAPRAGDERDERDGEPRPRALTAPAAALHALRGALLAAPDGELQLRDAGYVAGLALYDDFSAEVRDAHTGAPPPDAMPFPRFVAALVAYLDASGWGAARVESRGGTLRLHSADWVEGEPDAGAAYPACHFSTGVLAGFFGRAAGRSLAVLEVACRSAGDARCEFAIGSRDVLEALWRASRADRRTPDSA
jgi:hypothetical protein